jgi:hypothetical protein
MLKKYEHQCRKKMRSSSSSSTKRSLDYERYKRESELFDLQNTRVYCICNLNDDDLLTYDLSDESRSDLLAERERERERERVEL